MAIDKTYITNVFLAQIVRLNPEAFRIARNAGMPSNRTRVEVRNEKLLSLSAADFSWLSKQVQDAIRPMLVTLEWPDLAISAGVVDRTVSAAQAILCRDRLTPEQYEAFVGGFRQVGITIPPHPSEATGKETESVDHVE